MSYAEPDRQEGADPRGAPRGEVRWVDAASRRPTRFPEELKGPFEGYLPERSAG